MHVASRTRLRSPVDPRNHGKRASSRLVKYADLGAIAVAVGVPESVDLRGIFFDWSLCSVGSCIAIVIRLSLN